eukprot:5961334-Alexandrium_andersonii.AAC.1
MGSKASSRGPAVADSPPLCLIGASTDAPSAACGTAEGPPRLPLPDAPGGARLGDAESSADWAS